MNDVINLGLVVGFIVGITAGIMVASVVHFTWKERAVKQGKAEFYLDSNHNRQWRWKP